MNYTKPQVAVLGAASRVIENVPHSKSVISPLDGGAGYTPSPAYDLDE
jgi:hypothetical protein